jgi:hypothetical protein
MLYGHNTNLRFGDSVFHVQTEDRGESHALIDTTVYHHGRVLHRRTNNYFDLLPLNDDRRQALRLRLEDQHTTVIDEIRSGALQLAVPPASSRTSASGPPSNTSSGGFAQPSGDTAHTTPQPLEQQAGPAQPANEPRKLLLELTNAKSWLTGKHAKLLLTVREPNGSPVAGAQIRVAIEGVENVALRAQTNGLGEAQLEFEMPKITNPNAAVVIDAENHSAKGHLRFALRAKPRVA